MFFFGETFNVISLLGLMISVGLLVDNSVVVAENIHRLHQGGMPRRQAALQGAGEIALAITTATLTTVIVFLRSPWSTARASSCCCGWSSRSRSPCLRRWSLRWSSCR